MNRQLPSEASLENLKNQAKGLLRGQITRSGEAAQRIRDSLSEFRGLPDDEIFETKFGLQQAQTVLAREYGFKSWTHLKKRVVPAQTLPPWKVLRNAIDADDAAKVARLVERNFELVEQPLHEGEDGYFNQRHAALPYAAQGGRVRVVRYLAEAFPNLIKRADHRGKTPINTLVHTMATACAGLTPQRSEVYQFLKEQGGCPDLANATKANDLAEVKKLLSEGANPYAFSALPGRLVDGPAFVTAADAGHAEVVRLFLQHSAPYEKAAFEAFDRALLVNHRDVIHLLQPFVPTNRLSECLCGCCEFLNLEGVEFLLKHGADPNVQIDPSNPRSYPLLIALDTYSRKPWRGKLIELLIEEGATQWSPSPQMAIHRGRADLLAEFLDVDAELVRRYYSDQSFSARDLKGGTLLHFAAEYAELECVRLLLDRGAEINARAAPDENGIGGHSAIFHVAASYRHYGLPILRELILRGADLGIEADLARSQLGSESAKERRRVTPLGWARWAGDDWPDDGTEQEIAMLREAGAPE